MSKLYQLPIIGDWIDPNTVTEITVLKPTEDGEFGPRIIIGVGDRLTHLIRYDTMEEARAVRDEIAAAVNEAREGVE